MFYFVSVTAISHVHVSHIHVPFTGLIRKIITAQRQWGWGGGVVGVRGGDTEDTFHTISQHPTEAVLHWF